MHLLQIEDIPDVLLCLVVVERALVEIVQGLDGHGGCGTGVAVNGRLCSIVIVLLQVLNRELVLIDRGLFSGSQSVHQCHGTSSVIIIIVGLWSQLVIDQRWWCRRGVIIVGQIRGRRNVQRSRRMFWIYRIIPYETGKVTWARIWTTTTRSIIIVIALCITSSGSHLIQLVNVHVIPVTIVIAVVAVMQII